MVAIIEVDEDLPLEESQTNEVVDSEIMVELDTITIDVFFDGTGNNLFNTDIRLAQNPTEKQRALKEKLAGEVSYENDYSNIALLYKASTVNDNKLSMYIQGAGTLKEEKDDTLGSAFAWGKRGVNERVKEAFELIKEMLGQEETKQLILNVYGFSRGAFFARYFCALAKINPIKKSQRLSLAEGVGNQLNKELAKTGRNSLEKEAHDITINFVGIFDTVTSEGLSPKNDAKPFRQAIGQQQGIRKIFHLTAQNEFRNHFPLLEINNAVTEKNAEGHYIGFECSIPGAHSDIGGGYTKGAVEKNRYLSLFDVPTNASDLGSKAEIHWSWFKDKGYYDHQGQTLQKKEGCYGEYRVKKPALSNKYKVYASRTVKGNEYQYLSLNLMYQVAKEVGGVTFDEEEGEKILVKCIDAMQAKEELHHFNQYALNLIMQKVVIGGTCHIDLARCPHLNKTACQAIYHDYIHNSLVADWSWSGDDGITEYFVNGSNRNNKDEALNPTRIIYQVN